MANKGTANLSSLLAAAEKRAGLPAGTMSSIVQQETGGQSRFLDDPTAYHYAPNAQGQRIAGHTGKVSTAFGPFGILESTARDPGYGVAPLKDKSLEEQVRFATDYLAARSKSAGSLQAGLAGYGEGGKYADEVLRRSGGKLPPGGAAVVAGGAAPVGSGAAFAPVPLVPMIEQAALAAPAPVVAEATPMIAAAAGPNPWQEFLDQVAAKPKVTPRDLDFGNTATVANTPVVDDMPTFNLPQLAMQRPNFTPFMGMKKWG